VDLLNVLAVLAFLVVLVRREWNVGFALLLGAAALNLLYGQSAGAAAATFVGAVLDRSTLELLATIILITFLGSVLKHTEKLSKVVESLDNLMRDSRVTLAAVPFLVGLLTGLTIAPVGITFPILMPLLQGAGRMEHFMLAYVGGYMGVMLSPVHLCLVLTREYYGADFWRTYRLVIPLVAVVTASLFALAFFR